MQTLSKPQKILAVMLDLCRGEPMALQYEDIVVAAFKHYPEDFQLRGYVDIILKEAIYQLAHIKPSITADDVIFCMDDITKRVHDQASQDLNSFLFEEVFGAK
jgi:hypothetical protein